MICKKNIWIAIVSIALSVCLMSANATIVNASKNPAVSPGAVAYIGDMDGNPTPLMEGGAMPQSIFLPNDPIRIAQSVSLADLNEAEDDNKIDVYEGTYDLIWDYWAEDGTAISGLVWYVEWYDPTDTFVDFNLKFVSWEDIAAWKADPSLTQISFWTDLFVPTNYAPLMLGTWNADIYFDGRYSDTASFVVAPAAAVPVPVTLLLFATGLVMLRRRAK